MRRTAFSSPRLLAVALGVFLMGLGCAGGTEPAPPVPGAAAPAEAVEAPWANQVEADAAALFQMERTCEMQLGWQRPNGEFTFSTDGTLSGQGKDQHRATFEFDGTYEARGDTVAIKGTWDEPVSVLPDGCIPGSCKSIKVQEEDRKLTIHRGWIQGDYAFFEIDSSYFPDEKQLVACGEDVEPTSVAVMDGGGGRRLTVELGAAAATWRTDTSGARLVLDGGTASHARDHVEVLHDGREDLADKLVEHLRASHPDLTYSTQAWSGTGAPAHLVVVVGST